MQAELREAWRDIRYDNDVRCVILSAEGDHFCTGIDRAEAVSDENNAAMAEGNYPGYPTPWMYDDPGRDIGRKQRDCWKPVIAAVHGDELRERAAWAARVIADSPPVAVQGTMRALWTGLELSRQQGVEVANLFTRIGSDAKTFWEGQQRFESGYRPKWRLR